MSSPSVPGAPDSQELERTFGVYFIGYVAAMVGYGFTFFQTYVYYSRYPKDHWGVKATVATICLVDTAASALMSQALYYYLVNLFPYITGLVEFTQTFNAEIGLAVFGNWVVQMFYAYRIWTLSKNVILGLVLAFIATAAFGGWTG
ncbi:hypothetical protein HGRIS_005710 [Hohenbuehelia grisea]|uniref:Uncharacterized protein n=1 Tax=Hohenbuehelia grisea TaxID=104357 RepID=A0ABR3JYK7_9AGAR